MNSKTHIFILGIVFVILTAIAAAAEFINVLVGRKK